MTFTTTSEMSVSLSSLINKCFDSCERFHCGSDFIYVCHPKFKTLKGLIIDSDKYRSNVANCMKPLPDHFRLSERKRQFLFRRKVRRTVECPATKCNESRKMYLFAWTTCKDTCTDAYQKDIWAQDGKH